MDGPFVLMVGFWCGFFFRDMLSMLSTTLTALDNETHDTRTDS